MGHKPPEQALEILARELFVWQYAVTDAEAISRRAFWNRHVSVERRSLSRERAAGLLDSLERSGLALTWIEPDPGGEAAREAPPKASEDLDSWRVRHPGIGVLTYPDEESARVAAGTAGTVYAPGDAP